LTITDVRDGSDGFAGLEEQRARPPQHPGNQLTLPFLKEVLDIPFQACVMKGRSNYLCPRRLIAIRRRYPTNLDELRTLSKILVWLLESKTGDKSEISLRGPAEYTTWHRLSAQDEGCSLQRCQATMAGACPFYKARKAADGAHVLVINHALLVLDAMTENRVLPEYRHVIVDEAHQLEEAVTNGLSFRLDRATLQRRLADPDRRERGQRDQVPHGAADHPGFVRGRAHRSRPSQLAPAWPFFPRATTKNVTHNNSVQSVSSTLTNGFPRKLLRRGMGVLTLSSPRYQMPKPSPQPSRESP